MKISKYYLYNIKFKKYFILIQIILLLVIPNIAQSYSWHFDLDGNGTHRSSIAVDPYYTYIDYTFTLSKKPVPKKEFHKELNVYLHMLLNFYKPRDILVEASCYPFPIAGVYIKRNSPVYYNQARLNKNTNFIKAITAGFPEPCAFSFFLGNVNDFVSGPEKKIVGKGYSGFLISYGFKHIVDNIMVDDHWFETELKLKGSDIRQSHNISWSYSAGIKYHDNPEIKHALYLSIKRSRIDYFVENMNPFLKFILRNSEQEFRIDFDLINAYKFKIIRYQFLFGKKFPYLRGKVTFSLSLGILKIYASGYSGSLEEQIEEALNLIIRPNIHVNF